MRGEPAAALACEGRTGTNRGYNMHLEAVPRSVPCNPCYLAHQAYGAWVRNHRRCAPGLGWPLDTRREGPP
jgi:hypothetical protein